ncbi:TolC family protein [Hydrogenimonas sp.]
MRRWIGMGLTLALSAQAATIGDLFDALRRQPATRMDTMQAKFAELSVQKVTDGFYPSVSLFASFEHYNAPTNLRPMSPLESIRMGEEGKPLPFATTIERIGGKISMPIFIKELFSLGDRAEAYARSAKAKKRLNFLKNEALILGGDAEWRYLEALEEALGARSRSVRKIYEDTKIKVESGRAPGVTLDKFEESINRLEEAINGVAIKKLQVRSRIEAMTGMRLEKAVPLTEKASLKSGEIFALKPLEFQVEARRHDVRAGYDRLYPKVSFSALWSENYGQSAERYPNTSGDDVHRGYGNYMVALSMPLYEKRNYTQIEQARVELQRESMRLQKTKQEFEAEARALEETRKLLRRSIDLAKKSVANRENLLAYAKVAYETGRMSEEEYLRYEEGLLEAQGKVAESEAKLWQTVAQLAVIYGNDLEDIVK